MLGAYAMLGFVLGQHARRGFPSAPGHIAVWGAPHQEKLSRGATGCRLWSQHGSLSTGVLAREVLARES